MRHAFLLVFLWLVFFLPFAYADGGSEKFSRADLNNDGIVDTAETRLYRSWRRRQEIRMQRRPLEKKERRVLRRPYLRSHEFNERRDIRMEPRKRPLKNAGDYRRLQQEDADTDKDGIVSKEEQEQWSRHRRTEENSEPWYRGLLKRYGL
ncbi:MAG: hypothetical protein MJA29_05595 [Candidatus Omnitrophica bacterium]|nr:hypothetical protein [Candidatus Omnitrophota bacterium]